MELLPCESVWRTDVVQLELFFLRKLLFQLALSLTSCPLGERAQLGCVCARARARARSRARARACT
eukprot:2858054-Pleurochrysis_carterae.AAC.1